jgi:hypothetical protein
MTATLTTTMPDVLSADAKIQPRRAEARLAPGGHEPAREHDTGLAQNLRPGEAAGWRRILDLLDPDKRCGAWCPAACAGRPVVCTRAPHDAREQHWDAGTGWRWYGEQSQPQ